MIKENNSSGDLGRSFDSFSNLISAHIKNWVKLNPLEIAFSIFILYPDRY